MRALQKNSVMPSPGQGCQHRQWGCRQSSQTPGAGRGSRPPASCCAGHAPGLPGRPRLLIPLLRHHHPGVLRHAHDIIGLPCSQTLQMLHGGMVRGTISASSEGACCSIPAHGDHLHQGRRTPSGIGAEECRRLAESRAGAGHAPVCRPGTPHHQRRPAQIASRTV